MSRPTTRYQKALRNARAESDEHLIEEMAVRWFLHDIEPEKATRKTWANQPPRIKNLFRNKAKSFWSKPSEFDIKYRKASHYFPIHEKSVGTAKDAARLLLEQLERLNDSMKSIR